MIEVASAIANVVVLCIAMALHPAAGRCPRGWHHDGVRRSGAFACTHDPVGDPDWDGTHGRPDRSVVPPGELRGRVYCTGGAAPIVVDDRAVGCQR